jgi:hypothetical protein
VPERMLTVGLDGSVEYEASYAEVRQFCPGGGGHARKGADASPAILQRSKPVLDVLPNGSSPSNPLAALSGRSFYIGGDTNVDASHVRSWHF